MKILEELWFGNINPQGPDAQMDPRMERALYPLLNSLKETFTISPIALIPMVIMVVCIVIKFPATPAILAGIISGILIAFPLQGAVLRHGLQQSALTEIQI